MTYSMIALNLTEYISARHTLCCLPHVYTDEQNVRQPLRFCVRMVKRVRLEQQVTPASVRLSGITIILTSRY